MADSIISGDILTWSEPVWRRGTKRPVGERTITAEVVRESYGYATGQHTFSLLVKNAEGCDAPAPGTMLRRMGRNLYPYVTAQTSALPDAERDALRDEKHERGALVRAGRAI
jgi:hypothetical protein